jgi:hypothetical protein
VKGDELLKYPEKPASLRSGSTVQIRLEQASRINQYQYEGGVGSNQRDGGWETEGVRDIEVTAKGFGPRWVIERTSREQWSW